MFLYEDNVNRHANLDLWYNNKIKAIKYKNKIYKLVWKFIICIIYLEFIIYFYLMFV